MTSLEAMLFMKNEHNCKCKGSFKDSQRKCEYSEMNQIRYFIKTPFINKGIDIIDLPSILRDNTVESPIPDYFENKEPSIIFYKYNKPIRSTIFNFNKLVVYLGIDTQTPDP